MEYLTEEHRRLSEEKIRKLNDELPVSCPMLLQDITSQKYERDELLQLGAINMKENLTNALHIWQSLTCTTAESLDQKCFAETNLYATQIALGFWREALSAAQRFYNEIRSIQNTNKSENTFDELEWKTIFQATINLANVQRITRSLTPPEILYKEALALSETNEDKEGATLSKIYLAMCLLDKGQLKQAIQLYLEPLYNHKETMVTSTKILYLHQYGSACRSAADWGRAKMFLIEAFRLAKQVGDLDNMSACLGELGNIYRSEGRFKEADKCHSHHYHMALKRGDLRQLAVACGNLGFLKFYNPNELTESVVYLAVEYMFSEKFGDKFRKGVACNNMGKVYTALGHYQQAILFFEYVIDLARQVSSKASEGMAWGNLGTANRFLGKYKEAIECHTKYRENADERSDVGGVAIMERELALDYLLHGDLGAAETSIVGAFKTLEKIREQLGEDNRAKISNFEKNQSEALNLLQVILVAQGKHKEAFVISDITRARVLSENVARRSDPSRRTASKFRDVSSVLDREFIDDMFSQFLSVSRECKSAIVSYSLVNEFGNDVDLKRFLYIGILLPNGRLNFERRSLIEELTTEVKVDESFVISLCRSLSPSSDVELILKSISTFDSKESTASDEETDIEILLNSIDEELYSKITKSRQEYPSTRQNSRSQHRSKKKANTQTVPFKKDKEENIQDPNHAVRPSQENSNNQHVCHQLDSEFTYTTNTGENSLVKVKEPEPIGSPVHRDVKKDEIRKEEGFRNENNPSQMLPKSWEPFLFQLHEVLIRPISHYLEAEAGGTEAGGTEAGGIEKIIFVPQGFLLRVPFAALKADEKDKFLVEKFPILTTPSVTLMNLTTRQFRQKSNEKCSLLSVGNPKMPLKEIEQLPWAEIEARKVAEILGCSQVQILTDEAATKEAVVVGMRQHNIIHLASHAMVDEEESHGDYNTRGFVVLAKSNENCNGILTAEEVSRMDIDAELVVLSCCNTALGKVTEDGVLGLSRAFLTAGAACVVVTLWKIKDSVTSKLMETFYKCYKATRDAPLALQRAMQSVQDNGTMQQPHEWAAFTIVGCSGQIRKYL